MSDAINREKEFTDSKYITQGEKWITLELWQYRNPMFSGWGNVEAKIFLGERYDEKRMMVRIK